MKTHTNPLLSAEIVMTYAPAGMSLHVHKTTSGYEALLVSGDDLRFTGRGKSIAAAIDAALDELSRYEQAHLNSAANRAS